MRFQVYISEKNDNDILQYLIKLKSEDKDISKYIRKLIRQDMSNDYPLTREEILKIIEEHTKNNNYVKEKIKIDDIF